MFSGLWTHCPASENLSPRTWPATVAQICVTETTYTQGGQMATPFGPLQQAPSDQLLMVPGYLRGTVEFSAYPSQRLEARVDVYSPASWPVLLLALLSRL
jgi:hypothetical protein